jgi:hypothetical protein
MIATSCKMGNKFLHFRAFYEKPKKSSRRKWKTSFIRSVLPHEGAALRARMTFLPVTIFCKSAACPSSETLLSYRRFDLRGSHRDWIDGHLNECDFCRAELQLLNRYRGVSETTTPGEVPDELRKLAESVLANLATMDSNLSEYSRPN